LHEAIRSDTNSKAELTIIVSNGDIQVSAQSYDRATSVIRHERSAVCAPIVACQIELPRMPRLADVEVQRLTRSTDISAAPDPRVLHGVLSWRGVLRNRADVFSPAEALGLGESSDVRSSWRALLALSVSALVVVFAAAVILLIQSSRHPVDTATVYSGDLAAAGIALTLLLAIGAWWRNGRSQDLSRVCSPAQVAAAAERLAEVMADRWRRETARRRIITPVPVTVRWRWADAEVAAPRLDVTTPPAAGAGPGPLPDRENPREVLGSGVVSRLHDELYARLPRGRLVIVGGPGAGKTGR